MTDTQESPVETAAAPARKGLPLAVKLALAAGGLIGLVFVGLIALLAFFPKDAALAEIERQVEAATERDLTIGGDVSFTIWPALGFTAAQVSLSNPEGFPDTPFVAADRVVFAVALMPLFSGDVQVRRLYLEKPVLALVAHADGKGNWDFPVSDQESELRSLRLEDMRISGGRFTFQGAQGNPVLLDDVDVALAINSLDEPVEARGDFTYLGESLDFTATIGAPKAVLEQGVTPLNVEIRSPIVTAHFDGSANTTTGALDGALDARGASARRLFAWQGSPMPPGEGFREYSVRAHMAQLGDTVRLTRGTFAMDAIRATGNVTVVTSPAGRMTISGALSTPLLDLNPYLPAPPRGAAGVEVSTAWPTDPIDLSGLKAADANLDLTIAALKFQQLEFADARLALRIQNGVADGRLSRVSMYGGGGTARLVADARQRTPRIAVEIDAQNVQALPLLNAAIGLDKLEGRGRLRGSFVGQGASQAEIMRALNGNASFNFEDGRWKGVNLARTAQILQRLQGNAAAQGDITEFSTMAATFQIADGVAVTQDLRIVTPLAPISGTGLIDIGRQTLDLRLSAQGIGVPFRASGAWARPQFGVDTAAASAALRDRVQDQVRRSLSNRNLGDLGALFGLSPPRAQEAAESAPETQGQGDAAPAETTSDAAPAAPDAPAEPEKQKSVEERARDALGDFLRRNRN